MRRIILDTDPGIDDALALFLALASPEVELVAVTTVSGNVGVDQTTRNALALLALTGRTDIPVACGSSLPLVRQPVDAAYVHGLNGIGEVILPAPDVEPISQHATDLIIEKILQNPGQISLVAIGPLTNVALAVRREPRIAQLVREVVIMGGAVREPGNVTPAAEFNIYADPHAAHIVFHAGWPIRLVSLDATHRANLARTEIEAFTQQGGKVKSFIQQALAYYFDSFGSRYNITQFHMHDPLCLAAAFQPDLITWEPAYVDVELAGTLTLGETVAYFRGPQAPNAQVSVGVDRDRFIKLYTDLVGSAFA
ncbi:MAG TPA: nucleoside hydrolase [Ktedonosporobacter sp.]|nr:nucleoside hydrolase [Ktedonosporobacter sp.]